MTSENRTSIFDTLPEVLRTNLNDMGILVPTPIQSESISPVIEGKDLLGLSHTGSGKTLAFLLPMAVRLMGKKGLRAIVLTPTRELAEQVGKVFTTALMNTGLKQLVITGGASYQRQRDALRSGVDVVIGTPGRVVDLMNQGTLDLKSISMFVLDEVDEMLDVGFADDIDLIRKSVPQTAQTVFFSATMGPRTRRVADKILKNAVELKISAKTSPSTILHEFILVESAKILSALVNNLIYEDPEQAIVFCETKAQCSDLADLLRARGIPSQAINSDLGQNDRRRTLDEFRSGRLRYLIATNVAARGIDIVGLPLVVNMEPPRNRDSYTHRAGRTGRAGASGRVWTMLTPHTQRKYHTLMRDIGVSSSALSLPSKSEILLKFASNELEKMKAGVVTLTNTPSDSDLLAKSAVESLAPQDAVAILAGMLAKNIKRLNLDTVASLSMNDKAPRFESRAGASRSDDRRRQYGSRSTGSDFTHRREASAPRRFESERSPSFSKAEGSRAESSRAEGRESRGVSAYEKDKGSTYPEGRVFLKEKKRASVDRAPSEGKRESSARSFQKTSERSSVAKDSKFGREPFGKKSPKRIAPKR
jgi:ATP-dependent RNA helicase DeaD